MPIRTVVYTSEAAADIAAGRTRPGESRAKSSMTLRFNRNAGVTGVLLVDGERFVQYMEGPDDGLRGYWVPPATAV